ncbi:hypothetical protein P154DRAFT_574501 [Amniculicola lignicola CBS 123094]|uniref:Uncharacterized protein n=1 Tax=Amniculicola lignicola CBS 123094 TaxID=1392246 RepID=A0A6A5WMT1_9PLEO|nr:hypothetical protein P154DRAFT_574501 [Amniculicola lignicola CBS 123094]
MNPNFKMDVFSASFPKSTHRAIYILLDGIHLPTPVTKYHVIYLDNNQQHQQAFSFSTLPNDNVEHGFTDDQRLPTFISHCLNAPVVGNGATWAQDTIQSAGDAITIV